MKAITVTVTSRDQYDTPSFDWKINIEYRRGSYPKNESTNSYIKGIFISCAYDDSKAFQEDTRNRFSLCVAKANTTN